MEIITIAKDDDQYICYDNLFSILTLLPFQLLFSGFIGLLLWKSMIANKIIFAIWICESIIQIHST